MLMNNFESVNPEAKSKFQTHFNCPLAVEHEKKISLFILEECIQDHIGAKSRTIRTKDAFGFVIEIYSHAESVILRVLDKNYKDPVQTSINNTSDFLKLE